MVRFLGCLAILVSVCCTPPLVQKPGQKEATQIVWNQVYGMDGAPPDIDWKESLNCSDAKGWKVNVSPAPGMPAEDACVAGLTWSESLCEVAWHVGATFSTTAMAHEFAHAARMARGEDPDYLHKSESFYKDIARANAALEAAGL